MGNGYQAGVLVRVADEKVCVHRVPLKGCSCSSHATRESGFSPAIMPLPRLVAFSTSAREVVLRGEDRKLGAVARAGIQQCELAHQVVEC